MQVTHFILTAKVGMGGRIRHEKQNLWVSEQQYMLEMRKKNVMHQTKVGSIESNGQDWINAL